MKIQFHNKEIVCIPQDKVTDFRPIFPRSGRVWKDGEGVDVIIVIGFSMWLLPDDKDGYCAYIHENWEDIVSIEFKGLCYFKDYWAAMSEYSPT